MDDKTHESPSGTVGGALPGSLLGPVVGLNFSVDGELLFACSGSSLSVYGVRSGALFSTVPVFTPGVAVYGVDVGRDRLGAIFGDKYVRIVDGLLGGFGSWPVFPTWKIECGMLASSAKTAHTRQREEGREDAWLAAPLSRGQAARLLAGGVMALPSPFVAHNCTLSTTPLFFNHSLPPRIRFVEVWDWATQTRPVRVFRARGGDPCLLYHARLWGRTLSELRVAAGTVFNQVLVWSPGMHGTAGGMGSNSQKRGEAEGVLPFEEGVVLLRLTGHEGVIFRVSWREDGKQLASASDDRTARVWDVELDRDGGCQDNSDRGDRNSCGTRCSGQSSGSGGEGEDRGGDGGEKGRCAEDRLLWTGWGHASRVWDVGFTRLGIVTCGEDGSAILWRQERRHEDSSTARRASVLAVPSPTTPPEKKRGGGQLVPAAVLRGHSGASVWRLAVHEDASRSTATASNEEGSWTPLGKSGTNRARDDAPPGLALMATGGNDGACKLWDVGFEAACERRQPSKMSTLWGQTAAVPETAAVDLPSKNITSAGEIAGTEAVAKPPRGGHPPAAESESARKSAATAATAAATAELSSNPAKPVCGGQVRGRSEGRASRHLRRRQKPAVVREVRLARRVSGTAAPAAALLLTDGSVWWVADLAVGSWQPVTASKAAAGAGQELLSSFGVSAIAVVKLRQPSYDHTGNTAPLRKGNGEESATRPENDDRCRAGEAATSPERSEGSGGGTGDEVAIVVGRDDGWLFLLTRTDSSLEAASAGSFTQHDKPNEGRVDRRQGQDPPTTIPGPWTISAGWKGHRSRVTAIWVVGDVAAPRSRTLSTSEGGGSRPFTAALETSRVGNVSTSGGGNDDRGGFYGALVSAGADGTVAWWDWPRGIHRSTGDDCGGGGGGGTESSPEAGSRTAKIRMVCQAGPGGVVTSIAIDDRRRQRPCTSPSRDSHCSEEDNEERSTGSKSCPMTRGSRNGGAPPPSRATVFCGDTKGNIWCFLEEEPSFGCRSSKAGLEKGEVAGQARRDGAATDTEGVRPCLVLKRQHGNNQVSRLALLGDCLLSAGHDGQVNHYAISYAASACDVPPVGLTILTTYATAPVTAVSDLWVGSDSYDDDRNGDVDDGGDSDDRGVGGDARLKRRSGGGNVFVAVAGRSGSSSMSVWDVTEARQLLELECGDRHLAHDLLLSWSPVERIPTSAGTAVFEDGSNPAVVSSQGRSHTELCDRTCLGTGASSGSSGVAVGPSSVEPGTALPCSSAADFAAAPPPLVLPRHAFVVARPVPTTAARNMNGRIAVGGQGAESTTAPVEDERRNGFTASVSCRANEARRVHPFGAREQQQQQHHEQKQGQAPGVHEGRDRQQQPGVALAFHSSLAFFDVGGSSSRGSEGSRVGRVEGPGRLGYSLGKPFHGQRVASARFLFPGAGEEEAQQRSPHDASGLRLVTGGEEGTVKLLDVFYRQQQQQHPRPGGDSNAFHRPYARVVQTFPSHESSVGAVAVGNYQGGSGRPSSRRPTLVVSGGGKMEARAWHMERDQGVGDNGASANRVRAGRTTRMVSTCSPPVRWLSTTTPTPKSPLHAHRIMCMCVLPAPFRPSPHPDHSNASVYVSGDSGGGVTAFELRHTAGAAGGGQRETRSHPAGRWTAPERRPVLCLAHARVTAAVVPGAFSSAAPRRTTVHPPAVADLIATGDTGGTVTVWQYFPGGSGDSGGGGGAALPSGGGKCLPREAADVRGGFVHRGPAGRRRGGERASPEGIVGGAFLPSPDLVRVLDYRAHQMGVLCMAMHVPEDGGRVIIVTGGDDQAISVAELEVLHDHTAKPPDRYPPRGEGEGHHPNSHPDEDAPPRQPGRSTVACRLAGGGAEVMEGAAGSAIKGISLIPSVFRSAARRGSSASPAASVFTVSRDQRLSRWDLVEEKLSPMAASASDPTSAAVHVSTTDRQAAVGRPIHSGVYGEDLESMLSPRGGRDGSGETAQQGGRKGDERGNRWRLRWRSGCVTDVCDVSGLDAVLVPSEPRVQQQQQQQQLLLLQRWRQQEPSQEQRQQPAPIVEDETFGGCSPQDSRNGGGDACSSSCSATMTSGEPGTIAPVERERGKDMEEGEPMQEGLHNPSSSKEQGSSPPTLVVVSGQGLQLVLFNAS
ncbi:unnamed protein product [Scytosiphon promiscuus]